MEEEGIIRKKKQEQEVKEGEQGHSPGKGKGE